VLATLRRPRHRNAFLASRFLGIFTTTRVISHQFRASRGSSLSNDVTDIPVFILCGGLGTRLREETELRPKPMVPVGDHPILWHIMRTYSHHGFRNFILCLGYKADVIKSYFLNYPTMNSDFTIELKSNDLKVHRIDHEEDWKVTLADTGPLAMTGARVARAAQKYLGDSRYFAVTYGDGVTDADLRAEYQSHVKKGKIATVLGVNPPSRFGELRLENDEVIEFAEKPDFTDNWINGGYLFFKRDALRYLSSDEGCVLEKEPLVNLARDRELNIYKHKGFWYAMDTQRDREYLDALWKSGKAPWRVK
jgi:glucose-1-phosphate cytidylyltransferase